MMESHVRDVSTDIRRLKARNHDQHVPILQSVLAVLRSHTHPVVRGLKRQNKAVNHIGMLVLGDNEGMG